MLSTRALWNPGVKSPLLNNILKILNYTKLQCQGSSIVLHRSPSVCACGDPNLVKTKVLTAQESNSCREIQTNLSLNLTIYVDGTVHIKSPTKFQFHKIMKKQLSRCKGDFDWKYLCCAVKESDCVQWLPLDSHFVHPSRSHVVPDCFSGVSKEAFRLRFAMIIWYLISILKLKGTGFASLWSSSLA